eukprot:354858-Chlamydomonas_euryale.AAC.4
MERVLPHIRAPPLPPLPHPVHTSHKTLHPSLPPAPRPHGIPGERRVRSVKYEAPTLILAAPFAAAVAGVRVMVIPPPIPSHPPRPSRPIHPIHPRSPAPNLAGHTQPNLSPPTLRRASRRRASTAFRATSCAPSSLRALTQTHQRAPRRGSFSSTRSSRVCERARCRHRVSHRSARASR